MYSSKFKEIKLPHNPQQQANLVSQDAGTVPPRHTGHCFFLRVFWPRRMLQDSQPALLFLLAQPATAARWELPSLVEENSNKKEKKNHP